MTEPAYNLVNGRILVRDDEYPAAVVVTARGQTKQEAEALARLICDLLNAHADGSIVLPGEGR